MTYTQSLGPTPTVCLKIATKDRNIHRGYEIWFTNLTSTWFFKLLTGPEKSPEKLFQYPRSGERVKIPFLPNNLGKKSANDETGLKPFLFN